MPIPAYHTNYIVDASVAAKWFVRHPEKDVELAIALRSWHSKGRCRLVLPEFGILEILNAICNSPLGREQDGAKAIETLKGLNIQVEPLTWHCFRKANAIAWAYKVPLYDASYVALAEVLGYPFLTVDDTLLKKMKGHSIVLDIRELEFPQ